MPEFEELPDICKVFFVIYNPYTGGNCICHHCNEVISLNDRNIIQFSTDEFSTIPDEASYTGEDLVGHAMSSILLEDRYKDQIKQLLLEYSTQMIFHGNCFYQRLRELEITPADAANSFVAILS
tara:strand:- start:8464 stop:8835 length:372 start_codon:yes stop_codon:yes gene_type:complete